jgi:alpha-glucosidase (family GH31 glycosyl hydrolase)
MVRKYSIGQQTTISHKFVLLGLGERVAQFRLPFATYTLFARDQGTPPMLNLYGQHPFYLEMRDGAAHGVFLLNSNPMDVVLQPGALTYKVIGGVLDFFFIMGPTPDKVISQYHSIIGLPHFPPYWALGFHQCRWGYKTIQETANVVSNYEKYGIPLDAMWNDIDLMVQLYENFLTQSPLTRLVTLRCRTHTRTSPRIRLTFPPPQSLNLFKVYMTLENIMLPSSTPESKLSRAMLLLTKETRTVFGF